MQKKLMAETRKSLLLSLFVVGLLAALVILPYQFRSEAGSQGKNKGLNPRTESHEEGLENYDIREQKSEETADALVRFRQSVGKDASAVASTREDFVRGENELRTRVPNVKFEYNNDIRIPEVITPDVWKEQVEWLTPSSTMKRSDILRNFVKQNNSLIGVNDAQADALKVTADYTNPDGNLSYAHLEQNINGIPVFRGEVKAGFTKDGRIIRVINNLAPGLDYESLSSDFRNPTDAVRSAARFINHELKTTERNEAVSTDLKSVYGEGDWATTAEKMYFPTEPGVAVAAWRVLIWQPVNAYYVIVDAETGTMLWRKNITEDQTQAATYNVYNNANSYMLAADSPAPLSPGPVDPTTGSQGAMGTRTNVTLIGNEAPFTFNNNGWITDGANITDGNALEAGIDRDGVNGVDATQIGSPNRTFTSTWNPAPGSPAPGDDPLTAQAQRGAVTQMFYVMNRYHDVLYQRGYTEQAFNFQNDNFGRGGVGADRVSGEGQDSSGTNNANFATPADGGRGRMQMFVWTGPTPDYDGTADAEVIIHEVTHGTSNRLHGNASGLSTNMARGMGEGWGDWYAYTMLAEPTDPINGTYTTGGYATYLIAAGFTGNYYYGIRRFPRAPITFTGGPNNRPHNPFTFRYINAGCEALMTGNNSAFARGPIGSTTCDQVHNIGEVWSSMLWEVRNRMVTRLGFTAGTTRVLQVVTDGMKLAPVGPTVLQERDAIIAAAQALPLAPEASADAQDVREGFRVRGAGFSASIQNAGTGANNTVVTEAFDVPNAIITNPISVSDSTGDNDGFPEPGEVLSVTVPINNNSGATINNVVGNVTGGGSANYGNIADGATVTRQISYTVPAGEACGSLHTITVTGTSALGALNPQTITFRLGAPVGGAPVVVNGGAVANPATGTTTGIANPYPSTVTVSGVTGNKKIKVELTGLNTTYPGDMDWVLVGPGGQNFVFMSDAISSFTTQTNANVVFSDSAAATIPATGATNLNGEWLPTNHDTTTDAFPAPAPTTGYNNPAPAGAATFESVFGTNGATMNGTWSLYGRDDVSGDLATITGWKLTFESNEFLCSVAPAGDARADFDGDGRTDLSVFRPADGNWYLQRSTAGFAAINWGLSSDVIVPGDYDNDNKTDTAVFRNGNWLVLNSSNNTFVSIGWGLSTDTPMAGDYDNDGKTDAAVFRSSNSTWYVNQSGGGTQFITWGQPGDVPLVGDFDGDGKADLTVYRSGQWLTRKSSDGGLISTSWGAAGDMLVPANYDTDAKDDLAVFRPSNGTWYILKSSDNTPLFVTFGQAGDVPVPGDYDGDGRDDQAVYRSGTWFLNRSTAGFSAQAFGVNSDRAVPKSYIP